MSIHLSEPVVGCSYKEIPNLNRSPEERCAHVAIAQGKKLFVYGGLGENNEEYRHHIWVYESEHNSWIQYNTTGDIPEFVCGSRATLIKNQIFLFGGYNKGKYSNDVYVLNLDTHQWKFIETTGEKPSQRRSHVQWRTSNDIVVFGGAAGGGRYFNDTFRLDIDTMMWTQPSTTGTPPTRRSASGYSQRGYEEGYLFGGWYSGNMFNDLHMFDLTTNTWREIIPRGPLPTVRFGATMNVVHQDQLFVCGGVGSGGVVLSDCWMFDVERNEWKELKVNNFVARSHHTSCNIGEEVYIFGGWDANRKTLGTLGRFSFF